MIRLEPITPDNWRLGLRVREDQRNFVSDSAGILARAYAYRDSRSQAFIIYSDELPVGMAMYHDWDEADAYDFSQLFIDRRYQGRGFGLEAARLILEKMRQDGKYDKVYLCYIEGDDAAKHLYEKLGFRHTGEVWEDEITMELALRLGAPNTDAPERINELIEIRKPYPGEQLKTAIPVGDAMFDY